MQSSQELFGIPKRQNMQRNEIKLEAANAYGSTNTFIRKYDTVVYNYGHALTYIPSAVFGTSIIVNEPGYYSVTIADFNTGSVDSIGVSVNATPTECTSDITTISSASRMMFTNTITNDVISCSAVRYMFAGDIIRPHGGTVNGGTINTYLIVAKVS